jgi:hypothetical protein
LLLLLLLLLLLREGEAPIDDDDDERILEDDADEMALGDLTAAIIGFVSNDPSGGSRQSRPYSKAIPNTKTHQDPHT